MTWLLLLLVATSGAICDASDCPIWGDNCKCGNEIGGVVACDLETKKVSIDFGYCMTPMNDSDITAGMIVGRCPLTITNLSKLLYTTMTPNVSMCAQYRRDGQLCGNCMNGTGISYTLTDYGACHPCIDSSWVWPAFLAHQVLPPTIMFFIIVFARIRASSPHLNSVVFFCQMMAYPQPLDTISYAADINHDYTGYLFMLYNLWSMMLILPRGPYNNYCLHPSITFLSASLINYAACMYLFTLVIVVYLCFFCYDRGCKPVHCIFQPLQRCVNYIRSPWNKKGTLIDVVVTMVLLMYWRVTMITVQILLPTEMYNSNGTLLEYRHYFEASQPMFYSKNHLEMAAILFALVVLAILLFHPIMLACYQFQSVHVFLNKCSCRRVRLLQLYVKTLADTLQNSFKDGTNGTRDYRFFASFYFLTRLVGAFIYLTQPLWSSTTLAIFFLLLLLLVCYLQPHKRAQHNLMDASVYGLFVLVHIAHIGVQLDWTISDDLYSTDDPTGLMLISLKIIIAVSLTLPLVYFTLCVLYQVVFRCRIIETRFENLNPFWRDNLELQGDSVQVDRSSHLYPSTAIVYSSGEGERAEWEQEGVAPRGQHPYRYGSVRL